MDIAVMALCGILTVVAGGASAAAAGGLPNPFFAFKNSMETVGPASVEDQAKIIEEIGFDGFDNRDLDDLEDALKALDRHRLKLFTIYFTVHIDEGETPFNPRLPEMLPLLKDRGTVLWCNTASKQFKPSDPTGDERAVAIFRRIADLAAPYGVRLAPYPHIGMWVESPEDTARLADKVDRPNFGTSFNLFHWRALGDRKLPLDEVVRRVAPRMMAMSINGNDGTIEVKGISPLQDAQIDEYYTVLKAFRDAGYQGPVGLQCYQVPGNPRQHLEQSMVVWRKLKERFEKAGAARKTADAGTEGPMDISPSVYEHAARFAGRSPWDVSRDADLLYEAHAAAYRYYRHTPIMPGIDIYNLEPEAYGAVVEQPVGENIPAIRRHVLDSTRDLHHLAPLNPRRSGRIPMQIDVARWLHETFPEADIRVPISGPFSIASNLVGFDVLLYECATEPDGVRDALLHLADGQVAFAEAVRDAGVDVAFFESGACPPMLSPDQFRLIELPVLKDLMERIGRVVGRPVPCIIGGNTSPIVEIMLETGTGYLVCPFETDQPAFLRKVWDRTDVRVRVNADLRVISSGTWDQIKTDADRLIRLVEGRPNVCLGTGALPYETPPENVRRLMQYVTGYAE